MSAATRARASSGATWDRINWSIVQRHVRGLQARIVKATQGGRHNKAKALQWLLTHSFSGKAAYSAESDRRFRLKVTGESGAK